MSKKLKKQMSLLLCLLLCLSLFPTLAFGEEVNAEPTSEEIAEAADLTGADAQTAADSVTAKPMPDMSGPEVQEGTDIPETTENEQVFEPEEVVREDPVEEEVLEEESVISEEILATEEESESEKHISMEGLPKLAAPSNLHWDSEYPGVFAFTVNQPCQNQFDYSLYQVGIAEPISSIVNHMGAAPQLDTVRSDTFTDEIIENGSGDYYIGVRAWGDGVEYSDSDEVQTSVWHYEKPSSALPQIEKPILNGISATFNIPEGLEYATGIAVQIRFAKTDTDTPYMVGAMWSSILYGEYLHSYQQWDIYDSCLERNGPGFYSVRVCLRSRDITASTDGPWSEWSDPSNVTEIQANVRSELQQIAANADGKSNEEIRASVQALDTDRLKTAMETDQGYGGVLGVMAMLDNKLGGTEIEVSQEMASRFDPSEINVVGAQLNTPQTASQPIKFVLDKPKNNDVVPAMYNSSIAVRFSMDLENTDTSGMLDVPVKVTLPIPAGINPAFLAVLHYHIAGDEPEAIIPYVFYENGKPYASFVLSSFSDFIFTEERTEEEISFQTTLNLADYTGIFLYIGLPEGANASAYTVEASYHSYRQDYTKGPVALNTLPKGSGARAGMYKFEPLRAASTELSDTVTVTLKKDGAVVKTEEYSVRGIAEARLAAGEVTGDAATLHRALLQYGRYGQIVFNNRTDDLPGTEGAPALLPIPAGYAAKGDLTNFSAYVTKFEGKLDLNSAISMNLYLTPAKGYSRDSFQISVLDKDGNAYSKYSVTTDSSNRIRIRIEGILSPQMARNFRVVVTLKSNPAKTATWTRSVLSCAYTTEQTNTNANVKSLMQALYQYYIYAVRVFPQYQ